MSSVLGAPLRGWDIFMMAYQQGLEYEKDMLQIRSIALKRRWGTEWDLDGHFKRDKKVIVITDPSLSITFASHNITQMNGYEPAELIMRKPDMFRGPLTDPGLATMIRMAVKELRPFVGDIINYRKNGSPYTCHIEGFPVFNKKNEHVNYIAFENVVA